MNKAELIEALTRRLGDRKAAVAALDAVLTVIQAEVADGGRVAIPGFGVFESRVRPDRREPDATEDAGARRTAVPAFRAGATFRRMVTSGRTPRATAPKAAGTAKADAVRLAVAPNGSAVRRVGTTKATTAKTTTAKASAGSWRPPIVKPPVKRPGEAAP